MRAGSQYTDDSYTLRDALLTMLLLLAPMCRTSLGQHFHENKAGRSSYYRMLIVQYYSINMYVYVGVCGQNASVLSLVLIIVLQYL